MVQHFLPRFLLKGFACRTKGISHFVYFYRKGREPIEVNIAKVAAARRFYDGPKQAGLEAKLSVQEGHYALLLERLRKHVIGDHDVPLISEFFYNLMVRTKNLRDGFGEMGTRAFDLIGKIIQDPENRKSLEDNMINQILQHPEIKARLKLVPKPLRARLLSYFMARQGVNLPVAFEKFWGMTKGFVNIDQAVRDAQHKILAVDKGTSGLREKLKTYSWYVDERPRGTFVLGDVGPIARTPESSELTLPLGFGEPNQIYLPISNQHVLMGSKDSYRENVDVEDLNLASVELSRDFFISSMKTGREFNYRMHLGKRSMWLEESKIEESLKEGLLERARERK